MNKKQKIKRSQKILCAVFLAAAVICGGDRNLWRGPRALLKAEAKF